MKKQDKPSSPESEWEKSYKQFWGSQWIDTPDEDGLVTFVGSFESFKDFIRKVEASAYQRGKDYRQASDQKEWYEAGFKEGQQFTADAVVHDRQHWIEEGKQQMRDEVVKMCEGMKKGQVKGEDREWNIHYMGYDEAITDMITQLKTKGV